MTTLRSADDVLETVRTRLLAPALEYARNGWPVFPVEYRTRFPKAGFSPTRDEEIIRGWWDDRNSEIEAIATPCGRASGIVFLHFAEPFGLVYLNLFEHRHGPMPRTRIGKSGSGLNFVFESEGAPSGYSAWDEQCAQFFGEGNYLILPPSLHPNEIQHAWLNDYAPAPLPAWLREGFNGHHDGPNLVRRSLFDKAIP